MLVGNRGSASRRRERAEVEANALSDLYRHASVLPSPVGVQLRKLVVVYAKGVIAEEWPALAVDGFSDARHDCLLFSRVGSSQMLMTAALAGTIGAALALIAELQTPLAGTGRVAPYGIEQLLVALSADQAAH
jgi:hypothetical protein